MTIRSLQPLLCAAALWAAGCDRPSAHPHLDLATTTSLQNSGVLEVLADAYRAETGVTLRVHAAGSGRALVMLSDGLVHAVLSHAPDAEATFLRQHDGWQYRKFASNEFVVVGPPDDPAGVREANDAVDAFRRMARAGVRFVSRGDQSGTHERERRLWTLAQTSPPPDRVLLSGRGMALALRHADEQRAYTLSDEATYRQFESTVSLEALFAGGDALINTYAVVVPRRDAAALRFSDWLTRGSGRTQLASFTIAGRPAFRLWPATCADTTPAAMPCGP